MVHVLVNAQIDGWVRIAIGVHPRTGAIQATQCCDICPRLGTCRRLPKLSSFVAKSLLAGKHGNLVGLVRNQS